MTIKPLWEHVDPADEYRSDATSIIRFEAMHAVISQYSNRDANAYCRPSGYTQEILPMTDFFPKFNTPVRQRYGEAVWDQMMQLAIAFPEHMNRAIAFFKSIPEDLTIHDIGRASAETVRSEVLHQGLWYRAFGYSHIEVRTADGELVKREEFPREIWIDEVWLLRDRVYLPCKSYCLPTVLVHYDRKLAARSAIGHWMDPLPVGFWRQLKVPMS